MKQEEKLRELQLESFAALKELDRICKELNIQYFITAGTLLGAVRHNGFIPWDDDIDVVMKRADYDRFYASCSGFISQGFFFQDHHTEPAYPLGFAKLRKRGMPITEKLLEGANIEMGAFVDIFPLDQCPQAPFLAKLFFYGNTILNYALINRCNSGFVPKSTRMVSRFLWKVARRMPNAWLFGIRDFWRKAAALVSDGTVLCTVSGRHGYPAESYPAQWFDNTAYVTFEGGAFPAPHCWKELLSSMYGDYMTPQKDIDSHLL